MPRRTRHRRQVDRASSVRGDIQGLRAVAVLAVVLDHLSGRPSGGFVGVDVFFVVSGFLITGHLLRSIERAGRISLIDFYRRRFKRIVPSAMLVLVVGLVAAFLLYRPARFSDVLQDAIWSALFGANWRFAVVGTDYFASAGPVSPFQHYWSLAVEEQFYLVWPWLLLCLVLLARSRGRTRAVLVVGTAVLTAGSTTWALWESATHGSWAYFSTASRGWELGVGGLLAIATSPLGRLPGWLRPVLSWTGLGLVVLSFFVVSAAGGFPAPRAALPVVGAALVIAAGTGRTPRGAVLLTNPIAVRIGDLSYAIYLWHFPLIVLLRDVLPSGSAAYYVVVVVGTLALAIVTHVIVEEPIRRSRLLEPMRGAGAAHSRRPPLRPRVGRFAATASGLVLVIAVGAAGVAMAQTRQPRVTAADDVVDASFSPSIGPMSSSQTAAVPTPSQSGGAPALAVLRRQIRSALRAAAWPELHPDVASVGAAARVPEWTTVGCLVVSAANVRRCTWADRGATRTVAVIGDSIALSYLPAVRGALEPLGYRVVALDRAQCPAADVAVRDWEATSDFSTRCRAHLDWVVTRLRALRPDLIIASSARNTVQRLRDGATGASADAEWQLGLQHLLTRVAPFSRATVVLDPPPPGKNLEECETRVSVPSDCDGTVSATFDSFVAATERATHAAGVLHERTANWFCSGTRCPAFVQSTPIFADGQHLTGAYSSRLAPVMAAALARAGVQR